MSMPRLYEDAPRFIRQRLLAIEEGRTADAAVLHDFIVSEFGVSPVDVHASSIKRSLVDRWRARFGLPWYFDQDLVETISPTLALLDDPAEDHEAVRTELRDAHGIVNAEPGVLDAVTNPDHLMLSVLREYANEPVWRVPMSLVDRSASAFETPLHVLADYIMPWESDDPWAVPEEHLRPRSKDVEGNVNPLPIEVASAIRIWVPNE